MTVILGSDAAGETLKNIIKESGGKVWFKSKENIGSIFYFSLPAA